MANRMTHHAIDPTRTRNTLLLGNREAFPVP
jgi:hypothetical protein